MIKLINDLENLDFEDKRATKKILQNIENDILFWQKRNNKSQLKKLSELLANFASINSKGVYHSSGKRKFIDNIFFLVSKCEYFMR